MENMYIVESDGKKRIGEFKFCVYCNGNFLVRKKSKRKYCSRKCSHRAREQRVDVICYECGETTQKRKSQLSKSKHGFNFCSRTCKDLSQSLKGKCEEIRPSHYGIGHSNYRNFALENYESKCYSCGYNKYPEVLHVHHIDKNRKNSTLDNLEILCPTCHMENHFIEKTGPWKIKSP